jgi:hypothetical protein
MINEHCEIIYNTVSPSAVNFEKPRKEVAL